MEHRLDTLAKTLSGTLSRREIFRRLGWGLGAAMLVSLGLRGRELAECIQACHEGDGLCGPIVCPGGR